MCNTDLGDEQIIDEIGNNYKERHKIITSIEDELLSCEQFIIKRNYTVAADIKSLK